jgi:hypothetical protein
VWRVLNYLRGEHDDPMPYDELRRLLGYLPAPREAAPPPPPPVEVLKDRIGAVHLLHQALYGGNGTAHDGEG